MTKLHDNELQNILSIGVKAYLGLAVLNMLILLGPVYTNPPSNGFFRQDKAPFVKAHVISIWFHKQDNELSVFQWPPESPVSNQQSTFGV